MVRKISALFLCVALLCSFGAVAHAETYTPYEGTISSTYITYFRDIVSGIGFNDNYVAFRSGQYDYMLVVGDISYDGNNFVLSDNGTSYVFNTGSGYNGTTTYTVSEINDFRLNYDNQVIYSDLGQFPQLVERGAKYEMLSAVLICIALLAIVVRRVFRSR